MVGAQKCLDFQARNHHVATRRGNGEAAELAAASQALGFVHIIDQLSSKSAGLEWAELHRGNAPYTQASRVAGCLPTNERPKRVPRSPIWMRVSFTPTNGRTASTRKMACFESETLSTTENFKQLMDPSGNWID
jgi:hypothetical protein